MEEEQRGKTRTTVIAETMKKLKNHEENIHFQYCMSFGGKCHKWAHTVPIHVVQGSGVFFFFLRFYLFTLKKRGREGEKHLTPTGD